MGEHAIGFQYLIAGFDKSVLALQHEIDLSLKFRNRGLQSRIFCANVFSQKLRRGHWGFMQDGDAKRQALCKSRPLEALGLLRNQINSAQGPCLCDLAADNHFRQDHGNDLQVFDIIVGIDPLSAVLDDKNADRTTAPQEGNAHKGVEGILTRFGSIGEGRMAGCVREVQRSAQAHDFANQAFPRLHPCDVHGVWIEALGCEQLHVANRPPHIERANFRHHGLGDDPHDHVQT